MSKPISVAHIFYDINMNFSHQSLLEIFSEATNKDLLQPGEAAIFVNTAWTAVKILAADDVLLYHRDNEGLSVDAIKNLPRYFGGSQLQLTKTLESRLEKTLKKKITELKLAA